VDVTGLQLALLVAFVFLTSVLSGIFGMAGGLVLLAGLLAVLPVVIVLFVHGIVQLVANASRAAFLLPHVRRDVVAWTSLGGLIAAGLLLVVAYRPARPLVMLTLGLLAGLVWLPPRVLAIDVTRPAHAVLCGLVSSGLTIMVGVAGPILDSFFVRSALDRRAVVATKAMVQTLSHGLKVAFYGGLAGAGPAEGIGWLAILAPAVGAAVAGTALGGRVLERMTDRSFRAWTRWIISAVGLWLVLTSLRDLLA